MMTAMTSVTVVQTGMGVAVGGASLGADALLAAVRGGDLDAAAVLTDLLLEKGGSVRLEDGGTLVQSKERDSRWGGEFRPGKVCTGQYAVVRKGSKRAGTPDAIELVGIERAGSRYERLEDGRHVPTTRDKAFSRSFQVGESAVYGSFNLTYTGTVESISCKRVVVAPGYGDRTKSLDLERFFWRNWDYNEAETAERNAEISRTI